MWVVGKEFSGVDIRAVVRAPNYRGTFPLSDRISSCTHRVFQLQLGHGPTLMGQSIDFVCTKSSLIR